MLVPESKLASPAAVAFGLSRLLRVLTFTAVAISTGSLAASFDIVEETTFQSWKSVLYKNVSGNRYFCALFSKSNGTVFRINQYKDGKDTFLEIYDPKWTMIEGNVSFSMEFTGGDNVIEIGFKGRSWGDSYTYDILDTEVFDALLSVIAGAGAVTVNNSNGAQLAHYGLDGSGRAVAAFKECLVS